MRELELAYADDLAVIGVHSGKFIAERETGRIRDASLRLGSRHPTVNDRQFRIWRSYAVRAWPTLVAVDPQGYVVGQHAGEFTAAEIAPFLDRVIAAARSAGELAHGSSAFASDGPSRPPGTLCYPGKVALDGDRIAVADSGHHRLLVGRLDSGGLRMLVDLVVGSGIAALEDGAPGALDSPQGLAFSGDTLFVADSGNHSVRAVDLRRGTLRTVAGTGRQLRTRADAAAGALSSPWDVTLAGSVSDDTMLYVAMAGTHQLYAVDPVTGAARAYAGDRHEDIRDGRLGAAMLAQPMGIARDNGLLVFVDSETSAVRTCDTGPAGAVRTIAGTGLFEFGDRDGVGGDARLQHPQGIAQHRDGRLLVADSYNDALRWVDRATGRVQTWVRGLHEPGGVACGARYAYVADTNAHRICAVEYATGTVTPVAIELVGRGGVEDATVT